MQFPNLRSLLQYLGHRPARPCDPDNLAAVPGFETLEGRRLLSGGPGPGGSGHSNDFGAHNGPPAQTVHVNHGRDAKDNDVDDDNGVDANNQNDQNDDNGVDNQDNDGSLVTKDPHFYDFYVGPKRADLNVVAGSAVVKPGKGLILTAIVQGKIDKRPATSADDSFYVFGINRGSANAVTPFFQRPGVKFDAVVVVSVTHDNGISASVRDLVTGVATNLPADSVHIGGAKVQVTVDPSLLPPVGGLPLSQYTFNLWPRSSLGNPPANTTHDSFVASFLPENAMAPIQVKGGQNGRNG